MKRLLIVLLVSSVSIVALVLFIQVYGSSKPASAPAPQAAKKLIANDTDPWKGSRDPKVTVIAMSSFNCPACAETSRQMDQLAALYPAQVRIVWKDLPDATGYPYQAAIAARCAQLQGKFWQYHDTLFLKQDLIASRALYTLWAKELGLLTERFDACLDQEQTKGLVDANIAEGLRQGVKTVPYVQIGDALYEGPQTLSMYRAAIDQALATSNE